MKILLITQLCEPEPHFKGILFARELAALGHEVEVLTGFPNYPGGKIYPGYSQKLLCREDLGKGVMLTRVPLYPSHDQSAWRRMLNYASFALSVVIYGSVVAKKPDVIYAYHPPLSVALAGVVVSRVRRRPLICDIQDLWPDSLRTTGMISSDRLIRIIGRSCDWTYKMADRLVVLSPGFKRKLIERSVPENKIDVIPNWCDLSSTQPDKVPDIDWSHFENAFTILFAGNLGPAQDLDTILDAAILVGQADPAPAVRFIFVGSGIDLQHLQQRVTAESIDNVVFIPQLAFDEIGSVLQRADVLLVHLKKDPLFKITIPSKIQSSMAAGKPVLMAVEGDSADIMQDSRSGIAVEPGNAREIAAAALKMSNLPADTLREMGERAKEYYDRCFSIEAGCRSFANAFESVVKARLNS